MDDVKCPRCGGSVPPNAAFCGMCGAPMPPQQATQPPDPPSDSPQPPQPPAWQPTATPSDPPQPPQPPAWQPTAAPANPPQPPAWQPPAASLPPPPGYFPPPGFAPRIMGDNTKWALGLGIAALFCCGPITGIIGIILAKKDMDEIAAGRAPQLDEGWAKGAFYLNIVALGLFVAGICLFWGGAGLRRF